MNIRESCEPGQDRHKRPLCDRASRMSRKHFRDRPCAAEAHRAGAHHGIRRSCCRCTFGERAATPTSGLRSSPLIGTWAGFRRTSDHGRVGTSRLQGACPPTLPQETKPAPGIDQRFPRPPRPTLPPMRAISLRCFLERFLARALPPRLENSLWFMSVLIRRLTPYGASNKRS
jgi:hypothetical protein